MVHIVSYCYMERPTHPIKYRRHFHSLCSLKNSDRHAMKANQDSLTVVNRFLFSFSIYWNIWNVCLIIVMAMVYIYIYILHHITYRFCYCTPEPLLLINQKYDHRWFHAPLLLSWEFWVRIWYFGDNYSISWVQFLLLVISSILVRHWFIYTYMRKVNSTGSFANDWEFFWFSETLRDWKKLLWIREVRV